MRLKDYDYSNDGYYFITICTKNRQPFLGRVTVGRDDLGAPCDDSPRMLLSDYGTIVQKYINELPSHYECVSIDKYVIMPNHIHLIIVVNNGTSGVPGSSRPTTVNSVVGSVQGLPRPTDMGRKDISPQSRPATALIPSAIAALKKFSNKETGFNVWQTSYHDHIIRNEQDYQRIWEYIDTNPLKWHDDCFFVE